MKRNSALGFIETVGLASSITAADAALKAANVELIGRELSKGQGWVTIKITGDVAAVQAAIHAAKTAVAGASPTMTNVIPRPAAGLIDVMVRNKETTLKQEKIVEEHAPVEENASAEESVQAEESAQVEENALPENPSEEQPGEASSAPDEEPADTVMEESAGVAENAPKQEASPPKNAGQQNKHGKRRK